MAGDAQALILERCVPAAAGGDREAFATLVDSTRSVVSAIALAIVRDVDLSRDVAQDVFIAVWRDLGTLRDPQSFLPWLRQVTRHRAYQALRAERRYRARVTGDDADAVMASAIDPRPDSGAALIADEERRLVALVLDELPDDTREIVTLYYREGQSTAQVAALLGLTDATVRQRLARARQRLRASLLGKFGDSVQRSAPGSAFTGAVVAAASLAAPPAASAGAVAAAASTKPALWQALALLGGAGLGALGGSAGVLLGTRQLKRQARSLAEIEALRRFERVSVAWVVLAAAGLAVLPEWTGTKVASVTWFATYLGGLALLYLGWLPRIVRARHAFEAREDPDRAAQARQRERRVAVIGWTVGIVTGSLGLAAGLWLLR